MAVEDLSMLRQGGINPRRGFRPTPASTPAATHHAEAVGEDSRRDTRGWTPGTGFRNTGWIREREEAHAEKLAGETSRGLHTGSELGEPTSYAGGAGAPDPVQVMSGSQKGFQAKAGGPSYATPLQARQAFNQQARGAFIGEHPTRSTLTYPPGTSPEEQATAKFGAFRPHGLTLEETRITKEGPAQALERKAKARTYDVATEKLQREELEAQRKEQGGHFQKRFTGSYGPPPKEGDPAHQDYYDAYIHAMEHGEQAGMERFMETKRIRAYEPLLTPDVLQTHGWTPSQLTDLKARYPEKYRELVVQFGSQLEAQRKATAGDLGREQYAPDPFVQ